MPPRRTTPTGYERARSLRKTPTPAEEKLWCYLRAGRLNGVSFRRQHAVGQYVVDFCAPRHKSIIELDRSPHVSHRKEDAVRTTFFESQGYQLLRFWNREVMNDIEGVSRAVLNALNLL